MAPRKGCCGTALRYQNSITVQKPNRSATPDAAGAVDLSVDDNWQSHCARKARVASVSGRELTTVGQTESIRTHVVEMWGDSSTRLIQEDYRVQFTDRDSRTRTLGIIAVVVSDDGRTVTLSCREHAT